MRVDTFASISNELLTCTVGTWKIGDVTIYYQRQIFQTACIKENRINARDQG